MWCVSGTVIMAASSVIGAFHIKTQERLIMDLLLADNTVLIAKMAQAFQHITSCNVNASILFVLEVSLRETDVPYQLVS